MKLTAAVGSTAGLVGCSIPTIGGIVCSAAAPSAPVAGLSFSDSNSLKSFDGGICVDKFLDEKEKTVLKMANVDEGKWNQLTDKFTSPSGASKGCLAVSWDKKTWSGDYWEGVIRYEWLFSKGTETMVVHGFFDSKETGITSQNWKAVYINTSSSSKGWHLWSNNVSNQAELATKMPKRPRFFDGSDDYWSFKPDYNKKCPKSQQCNGSPWNKHFESTWKWRGHDSGSHFFCDWTTNYSSVFDSYLDVLKGAVTKEKGTWESF